MKKLAIIVIGIPVALLIIAWMGRAFVQYQTSSNRTAIDPVNGFDELLSIEVNGSQQWVQIRGVNRNHPALLVLHGGPGVPLMALGAEFQNRWETQYNVVHWDQRGNGKTYFEQDSNDPSFDDMLADAVVVTQWLRNYVGQKKIFLLGHSWGTMLGAPLVQMHPQWFHAYIATGVVIEVQANEQIGYAEALAEANRQGNEQAMSELEALAPYPGTSGEISYDALLSLRLWQTNFGIGLSRRFRAESFDKIFRIALASPDYDLQDVTFFLRHSARNWHTLNKEFEQYDARLWGNNFEVPVVYILGRHDWQTPSVIAEQYFWETLDAPHKRLVWLEESAHSAFLDEPDVFARELIAVKQLAL